MKEPEFANEMRRLAIVKLYELGKLSSGKAGPTAWHPAPGFFGISGHLSGLHPGECKCEPD